MALDNSLIKKPHTSQSFTNHQLVEFMKCADPDTGYLYFLTNYYYIQHPVKGKLLFEPFDYQLGLLESYHKNTLSINMLGRQLGKTTCAAGYILWFSMFHPDKTILISAHKYSGAQEIMQRIRFAYEDCPDYIRAGVVSYNKGSIELDNGSRIVSTTTTENTGRGMSISLLYADELSAVKPNMANAMWTSISPTLATGGKAIITSTPNTDDDLFATLWKGANDRFDEYGNETVLGKNGFFPYAAIWSAHPDRDESWAAQERSKIGDAMFEREHEGKFVTFEETLINPMLLATMEGKTPIETIKNVRWYKELSHEMTYVVALDPSLGTGGDNAGIEIYELPTFEQVGEWQHNLTPIDAQIRLLREILIHVTDSTGNSEIYWSIENNSLGEAGLVCIKDIGEEKFPGTFLSEPRKKGVYAKQRKGFTTTNKSKLAAAARLKYLIESGKMGINSKPLVSELKNYIASGAGFAAKSGKTDDLISAVLLVIRMSEILSGWDIAISNAFSSDDSDEEIDEYDYPMPIFASFS